ncbi:MAG: hypothetical protein A2527_10715 [Candidatus Lambdaproteobacteria bacterium RIFOXYD2_FULL_50_16]|uniref:Cytochrome C oxidase subunit II n=1 Tax=Candidatus Lambdaproteobacteria bacterium RIFOXYD2_FULL_50_16 TaxID=1817772 RepID=A0A1F6GG94_9PROT|nr:MAG: hypothetical protein A2527_10715 [Candidatus Lambdaproteobacteria bacterium RIFOXYD2_FULL_50_16]
MNEEKKDKNPRLVDPESASAVGSRNSANRDERNEYVESQRIIDEEVDKILNHVASKLPPEVLEKLHVTGSIKEILHNYFNQGFHNMYNRYLVTVEDEMSKKFNKLVDDEEQKNLSRYTPQEMGELIDEIGGAEKFNNRALEMSVVNIYQHLQGHLEHGVHDMSQKTAKLLREKTDIGLMVGTDNAFSLVKGHYSDNKLKPEWVTDVSLTINIAESELLNPVFHFQVGTETIIREVLSDYIVGLLDKELDGLNAKFAEEGQAALTEAEQIIEKFKRLEKYVDFEANAESPQFQWVSKDFLDAIHDMGAPGDSNDPLNLRENIQRIVGRENLRNRGFNKAVNALTEILDKTRLGYQHIENFKQAGKVVIREYSESSLHDLPDERYSATLVYYDNLQLREMRNAYCAQLDEFGAQANKLWNVYEKVHENHKKEQGFLDYHAITEKFLGGGTAPAQDAAQGRRGAAPEPQTAPAAAPKVVKEWDEVFFVQPKKSDIEKLNDTFGERRQYLTRKFQLLREKIHETFKYENPPERVILDQRLDFLESEFSTYNRQVNPYHLRSGLVLEINLTTIKRKESTMQAISNVIADFLDAVAAGFVDQTQESHIHAKRGDIYEPSFIPPPGLAAGL